MPVGTRVVGRGGSLFVLQPVNTTVLIGKRKDMLSALRSIQNWLSYWSCKQVIRAVLCLWTLFSNMISKGLVIQLIFLRDLAE